MTPGAPFRHLYQALHSLGSCPVGLWWLSDPTDHRCPGKELISIGLGAVPQGRCDKCGERYCDVHLLRMCPCQFGPAWAQLRFRCCPVGMPAGFRAAGCMSTCHLLLSHLFSPLLATHGTEVNADALLPSALHCCPTDRAIHIVLFQAMVDQAAARTS